MPTTYAHWVFGKECYNKLPEKLKKVVDKHRDLYDIGLHGPDVLFYYLFNVKIVKHGSNIHELPAKEFFKSAKYAYVIHNEKEEMMAYLLGFVSHFTLDTMCHGYVERKKEVSKISHNRIEAQWDRHLIVLDDRKPNLVDRSESLKVNFHNTKIISYFFPFSHFNIYNACKWQIGILSIINCFSIKSQKIKEKILRILHRDDFAQLFIDFYEDDTCKDSNLRLDKLKKKALNVFPKMISSFYSYLIDDEKLNKTFDYTFGPHKDYKKIPVYSLKKEKTYKVK